MFKLLLLTFSFSIFANEMLKESEILQSTEKSFPLVLEALTNVEAAKMKVRAASGGFDTKLKLKNDQRLEGHYSGNATDVRLEKPLPFMNAKVFAGKRFSTGTFPTYEGKYVTADDGENIAGIAISLLQDRSIDLTRLDLWNNKLNVSIKELKVQSVLFKIKKMASVAYWDWVAQNKELNVLKELLQLAINRQDAITKKVKRGDMAEIYKIENEQYILKRKNQVLQAQVDTDNAALYLSLFYRDANGNPIVPSNKTFEDFDSSLLITEQKASQDIKRSLEVSPDLNMMDFEIKQFTNERLIGENKLMPRLDLQLEVSKDGGDGSKTLLPQENRAMIQLEIPIERNLGRGKVESAKAQISAIKYKRSYTEDQIQTKIQSIVNNINMLHESILNYQKEVELAQILEKAEIKKFEKGASDFFVINIREQNTADAKIKLIKANFKYKKNIADYKANTFINEF